MKVLHVIPSVARIDGGPSEVIRGWLGELPNTDFSMRVLATDKGISALDGDLKTDRRVTLTKARWPQRYSFSPGLVMEAFRLIRAADLVHVHSVHTFPSTVALWMAKLLRRKVVLQPHGALDAYHWRQGEAKKAWYSRLVDGPCLRHIQRLVVSTPFEADQRSPGWSRKIKTAEVTLGVDPSLFEIERATPPPSSEPVVLFLGRITQKKRLDIVLEAAAVLLRQGAAVRVIVAGPVDEQLGWHPKALAKSLGIEDAVEFLGSVDRPGRRDLFAIADAFVLPSDDESFGVSVAEALASSCHCVVTSNVGIARDAALAGALQISPPSAAGVAEALSAMFEDEDRGPNKTGRVYAQSHFTWHESVAQLASMYKSVLPGSN